MAKKDKSVSDDQINGSEKPLNGNHEELKAEDCLLYTSDAADDLTRVDLGGRRIIKKMYYINIWINKIQN